MSLSNKIRLRDAALCLTLVTAFSVSVSQVLAKTVSSQARQHMQSHRTHYKNNHSAAKSHVHASGNVHGADKTAAQHGGSGKATIYSDKFNGKKTANGERFSQGGMTGASPSLPIGSKVKVTNKATGKSATIKINDKQPRGGGKVVDLSKAAANKLGVKGTANVTTSVVKK
jgi:rare lipoprotein A (peptidoglycan hydrolase)